jgi:hypothetical protein
VPLQEDPQRPGRYTGSFTVPPGVTARDVPVIGELRMGSRIAPLIQAGSALGVDSQPPAVSEASPPNNTTTNNQQPDIYAEFSDGAGTGVDTRSIRMTVGGQDVSNQVKVTPRFLIYTPRAPLPPGPVPVTVTVRDLAGNQTRVGWTFNVLGEPSAIQSVTHTGDRPLRAGDVLTVVARGARGGSATFNIGDAIRGIAMRETSPGVYSGQYTVRNGDQFLKAPVVVDFIANGRHFTQRTSAPVNLVTRPPRAPAITGPVNRFELGDQLVVAGTADPGSKVTVEVGYEGRAFGALPLRGTFGSQEVTVGANGRWATQPFDVRLPLGVRRPDVTIRAVATDPAGTRSNPTEVRLNTR